MKPYGFEVTVEKRTGAISTQEVTYHWRGCTEAAARRKAMLKTGSLRVIKVEAMDQDTWYRAYGVPGRM